MNSSHIPHFRQHFDTLQDRLICFTTLGFQSEGWFKGELLTLLTSLQENGWIESFDRKVRVNTQRIDVVIKVQEQEHWIELKHWLIGRQRGTFYNAGFYFKDASSVGIIKDVAKLSTPTIFGPR